MSTKHFFPSTDGVVVLGLQSLVSRNSHLELDVQNKVVYSKAHNPSQVTFISGGGSGHEPAWSGYVGDGMLAAAVCGEVFASPSTKQVMAAIRHVPSDAGIVLCITNYTGDSLHFGLAAEKAAAMGVKIGTLKMTDDVALGRKQTENTGRRGLAANMWVLKLGGSAAAEGCSFEDCMKLGNAVNGNAVTVGSSLDHCHIPGREHHRSIPQDAYVLGMGVHNEPGLHEINPMPPVEELVADMLKYCLDPNDKDRAFVEFKEGDQVILLINNLGGMSHFEIEALTTVTRKVLAQRWKLDPVRTHTSFFETSLNAPGWSISLLNISGIERETKISQATILQLLDRDTTAPAWPKNGHREVREAPKTDSAIDKAEAVGGKGPKVDATLLESSLRQACQAAIKAEPDITKWDIQMGDGDCGEAVVGMCEGTLKALNSGDSKDGHLFTILDPIGENVEEIGGTLGAIISILLASFTLNLRKAFAADEAGFKLDAHSASRAINAAIQNLTGYTGARKGNRTVMDALIPFGETFEKEGDLEKAVQAAEEGAKSTSGMKASFGRASYVGDTAAAREAPPDPGAMAAAIFLRGLVDGLKK